MWLKIELLHRACNLKCSIPKEIDVVFHKWSEYDYFIVNELAEEFEGQVT